MAVALGSAGRHLAQAVADLRACLRLDQTQLAARVTEAGQRMTRTAVVRIEAAERRVHVDDLVALAAALEVAPDELLPARASAREESEQGRQEGPVHAAVREDIEALGDLEPLDGMAPSLAACAYALAREIDRGGGEGGKALHQLTRELRSVLSELAGLEAEGAPDDDDLGDLAAPD